MMIDWGNLTIDTFLWEWYIWEESFLKMHSPPLQNRYEQSLVCPSPDSVGRLPISFPDKEFLIKAGLPKRDTLGFRFNTLEKGIDTLPEVIESDLTTLVGGGPYYRIGRRGTYDEERGMHVVVEAITSNVYVFVTIDDQIIRCLMNAGIVQMAFALMTYKLLLVLPIVDKRFRDKDLVGRDFDRSACSEFQQSIELFDKEAFRHPENFWALLLKRKFRHG